MPHASVFAHRYYMREYMRTYRARKRSLGLSPKTNKELLAMLNLQTDAIEARMKSLDTLLRQLLESPN